MRKSTTLARMMKNRNRGIPKPLFQSVQFPTLITTSSTLYQVQTRLSADLFRQISESFSMLHAHCVTTSPFIGTRFVTSYWLQESNFSLTLYQELVIELTTWKPNDHVGVITVKRRMIKRVGVLVCHIHIWTSVSTTALCVKDFLMAWLHYTVAYCGKRQVLIACVDRLSWL